MRQLIKSTREALNNMSKRHIVISSKYTQRDGGVFTLLIDGRPFPMSESATLYDIELMGRLLRDTLKAAGCTVNYIPPTTLF